MDLAEIHQVVGEALPDEPVDGDVWRAGVLLLAAMVVSPSMPKLRAFTGLPVDFINRARFYLRACGVWSGNQPKNYQVVCEWAHDDPRIAEVAFVCDCLVAAGRIVRTTAFDAAGDPVISYRARTMADYSSAAIPGADQVPWCGDPDRREARRLALAADHRNDPDGPRRRAQETKARHRAKRAPHLAHIAGLLAALIEEGTAEPSEPPATRRPRHIAEEHEHVWRPTGTEKIGGKEFVIDVCDRRYGTYPCRERRARALTDAGEYT